MALSVLPLTTLSWPADRSPAWRGCTHGALAGFGGGRTSTVTASGALSNVPSFTTSENARSVRTDGAVKVGVAAVVLLRLTAGPPVCVHLYV